MKSDAASSSIIESMTVSVPARSLRNIESSQVEKTFSFVVGDDIHRCHWFVAEFLSPVISRLRQADSTIDCYHVQTPNCSGIFGRVLSIGYGCEVEVAESARDVFVSLCTELGNSDLRYQIVDVVNLTCENAVSRL
jgi:hypothetical protein